jgi:hypothetical protein
MENAFVYYTYNQERERVTLRLTVYGQSVRLDTKPFETHDQRFLFSTEHLLS